MINNSWTTPTTDDVDIKLTQNDFLSKNKIQQNTESQNRIYNGFDDNSNSSFQNLLRKSSNYQVNYFISSHFHIDMFRYRDYIQISLIR